jgi:hypothetical protein
MTSQDTRYTNTTNIFEAQKEKDSEHFYGSVNSSLDTRLFYDV